MHGIRTRSAFSVTAQNARPNTADLKKKTYILIPHAKIVCTIQHFHLDSECKNKSLNYFDDYYYSAFIFIENRKII